MACVRDSVVRISAWVSQKINCRSLNPVARQSSGLWFPRGNVRNTRTNLLWRGSVEIPASGQGRHGHLILGHLSQNFLLRNMISLDIDITEEKLTYDVCTGGIEREEILGRGVRCGSEFPEAARHLHDSKHDSKVVMPFLATKTSHAHRLGQGVLRAHVARCHDADFALFLFEHDRLSSPAPQVEKRF